MDGCCAAAENVTRSVALFCALSGFLDGFSGVSATGVVGFIAFRFTGIAACTVVPLF